MVKTICCIPARLGSKRLPHKLMLPIQDKPILQHTISQCAKATKINELWIVTTKNSEDDEIEQFLRPNGKAKFYDINLFRGEEKDIISRIVAVAGRTHADYIISVDGEQPLSDPRLIDKTVEVLEFGYQFVAWRGMPLGLTPIGFSKEWLKTTFAKKDTRTDHQWWKLFQSEEDYCVDTKEDYLSLKSLIEEGKSVAI